MRYILSLLSLLSFLAWSLLVTVGIGGLLFEKFVLIAGLLAAFYCAGLGASVWTGFFARDRLAIGTAAALQLALLILAVLTLGGGVTLLVYWLTD